MLLFFFREICQGIICMMLYFSQYHLRSFGCWGKTMGKKLLKTWLSCFYGRTKKSYSVLIMCWQNWGVFWTCELWQDSSQFLLNRLLISRTSRGNCIDVKGWDIEMTGKTASSHTSSRKIHPVEDMLLEDLGSQSSVWFLSISHQYTITI